MFKIEYLVGSCSDIGAVKKVNQDSLCIKIGKYFDKNIVMSILCDGLGGLKKGELASGTVISAFSEWFEKELPLLLDEPLDTVMKKCELMIKNMNARIFNYGKTNGYQLGTTISGVLIWHTQDVIVLNAGDTRVYTVKEKLEQITEDHTFVALKVKKGIISENEAANDSQRNVLTQCIGGAEKISPQIIRLNNNYEKFLLCTDGFRNKITEDEIFNIITNTYICDESDINNMLKRLTELNMLRGESDNISAVYIIKKNLETHYG